MALSVLKIEETCYGREDILNVAYKIANEIMSLSFGERFDSISNIEDDDVMNEIYERIVNNISENMSDGAYRALMNEDYI